MFASRAGFGYELVEAITLHDMRRMYGIVAVLVIIAFVVDAVFFCAGSYCGARLRVGFAERKKAQAGRSTFTARNSASARKASSSSRPGLGAGGGTPGGPGKLQPAAARGRSPPRALRERVTSSIGFATLTRGAATPCACRPPSPANAAPAEAAVTIADRAPPAAQRPRGLHGALRARARRVDGLAPVAPNGAASASARLGQTMSGASSSAGGARCRPRVGTRAPGTARTRA